MPCPQRRPPWGKFLPRHLEPRNAALRLDAWLLGRVLRTGERKQAKEQEKEQKEFELVIADRDAEIMRRRAKGEGDSIRHSLGRRGRGPSHPLERTGEGAGNDRQDADARLPPLKLYDSQNSKFVLLPDKLDVPVLINPGSDKPAQMTQDPTMRLEDDRSGRYDSNRFHREAGTSVLRPSNASRCPFPSEMPRLSEGLSRERPSLLWNALM